MVEFFAQDQPGGFQGHKAGAHHLAVIGAAPYGGVQRFGRAGNFNDLVRAALCHTLDLQPRVAAVGVDGFESPQALCHVQPVIVAVHRDDVRTVQPGQLRNDLPRNALSKHSHGFPYVDIRV